jgi:argininosuccinate lyase
MSCVIVMASKLWGGRFDKPPAEALFEFCSSEDSQLDEKLALYDIAGSIAHVAMLSKQKILSKEEAGQILSALLQVKKLAEQGKLPVLPQDEDVHTAVETAVTKLTPNGKKMHSARSRNDQLNLDGRLYLREAINSLSDSLLQLQQSLAQLAKNDCIFPAYTHFQVAQPISLSFWCHAHYQEFERALSRLHQLYGRVNENPLGSGAVAGTTWPIDRSYTSKLLGFAKPTENPLDSVSNRGELEAELISMLTLASMHCSRISEDIILMANKKLLILPDEYSAGSSMMPQKKNPDPLELVRGKSSRMLGLLVHTASISKNLSSGFNRDTQETKFAVMQAVDTMLGIFAILSKILPLLQFNEKKIAEELEEGYACATEIADLFAKKGVPFRTAHELTGKIVKDCILQKKYLSQLTAAELSKLASVTISQPELASATSVDKVARFALQYKFPKESAYAQLLSERKAKLAAAAALLEKEVKAIIG